MFVSGALLSHSIDYRTIFSFFFAHRYLYSSDNYVVSGALLAIGIVNCGVQNENDPAFALIYDYVGHADPNIRCVCVFTCVFCVCVLNVLVHCIHWIHISDTNIS